MSSLEIFKGWDETIIQSCLQKVMGEMHLNSSKDSGVVILGAFAFYAGKPDESLFEHKSGKDYIIMVPHDSNWAKLIEEVYKGRAEKVTRYAIKKEKGIFDVEKLQQAVKTLHPDYVLREVKESEYSICRSNSWAWDLVGNFKTFESFKKLGLGIVAFKGSELVAGASSYSRYRKGIEIDTKEDFRRKGLAYACSAKLILECLKRGLYPSWDAANMKSVKLAEKLGYHFSHEYQAYHLEY